MRILVIEDEEKIAKSIKKGLEQERFTVDLAHTGMDGYDLASTEDYDCIVLDLMLPEMNGIEVCTKLRQHSISTPILMLTAKSDIEDKILGLNTGADDYLAKPFDFDELVARVRALLRRPKQTLSTILTCADLSLDTKTYNVYRGETLVTLSKREFALLEYLLRNKGSIVSKDQIMAHVWNFDDDVLPNTVEQYIGYLRKKIDISFPKRKPLLHTVRGFGYRLGEI